MVIGQMSETVHCETGPLSDPAGAVLLLRRGRQLEYATLGWNVISVAVLAVAAMDSGSVALAGFGLDSLIEISASIVVLWRLAATTSPAREQRAIRLIGMECW